MFPAKLLCEFHGSLKSKIFYQKMFSFQLHAESVNAPYTFTGASNVTFKARLQLLTSNLQTQLHHYKKLPVHLILNAGHS